MAPRVHVHTKPVIFFPLSGEPALIWTYLDQLSILAERLNFLGALPRVYIEVMVPDLGAECPYVSEPTPLTAPSPTTARMKAPPSSFPANTSSDGLVSATSFSSTGPAAFPAPIVALKSPRRRPRKLIFARRWASCRNVGRCYIMLS